jgi:TnpA family transposase
MSTSVRADAQQFPVGRRSAASGQVNLHYDRAGREALYPSFRPVRSVSHDHLVDGLLYHETDIEIAEHYSDTAAFSDLEREECHDHRAPRRPPSCGRSEAVHGGHSEAVRSS